MRYLKLNKTIITAGLVLLSACFLLYARLISPTKVAFINFLDFQYAVILDADKNPFIRTERILLKDTSHPDLTGYKAVYMFGMGLKLNSDQVRSIKKAIGNGAKIYVYAATSDESDLTNLAGRDLEYIEGYFSNGGKTNIRRLLNYTRRVFDGKKLFSEKIKKPVVIPGNVFFHLGDETFFTGYDEYQKFYEEKGLYKKNAPKVAIVTTNIGPRNPGGNHIDMLIKELEGRGLNVYPVSGFSKRMEFLEDIDPQLVILFPHGRFIPGKTKEAVEWLNRKNIPLLCPLTIFSPYKDWIKSQQGMAGGMLSQSVVMPELDGGIDPYVIGAQFRNDNGLYVFKEIPNRIRMFGDLVEKWLALKRKPNSGKKVAIYYYKGPGRNAMVAGGMEVAPSLLSLLKYLKSEGYKTGKLPDNADEFLERIQKEGPVLGVYAKGAFDKYLEEGNPELIDIDSYRSWCGKDLVPELYEDIEKNYGPAPGEYMNVYKDGKAHIAIARVRFGNIVILPQPLPAYGDNEFKLVHGAKKAPPHSYVASYLWAKNGFGADAIMHFGTHGSLEFTPWKQVALSEYDWPETLVDGLPHIYIYVISNIGEAVIAKRRSYAALVSHITPPFTESDLYGELADLHGKINSYAGTDDPALKSQYKKSIKKRIIELGLHKDLGMENFEKKEFTKEIFDKFHNYIHTIEQEKITRGLYVLGEDYEDVNAYETVRLMAIDPLAYSMAKVDLNKGKITRERIDDAHFFDMAYRQKAFGIIDAVLKEGKAPETYLSEDDAEELGKWDKSHPKEETDFIAGMIRMMESDQTSKDKKTRQQTPDDLEKLKELILKIAPHEEQKKFLLSMKNEKKFNKISAVLDPASLEKAKKVARFVPAMKEQLDLATREDMKELIGLMQDEGLRKRVFGYLSDKDIREKIEKEKERLKQETARKCLDSAYSGDLFVVLDENRLQRYLSEWDENRLKVFIGHLRFYLKNINLGGEIGRCGDQNAGAVAAILRSRRSRGYITKALSEAEKRLDRILSGQREKIEAIRVYRDTLFSIQEYYSAIVNSPGHELDSVVNGLRGGYISPSSGGDPVSNPGAVPTGRNMYSIDAEKTPTEEAWKVGVELALDLIAAKLNETGEYPGKVAFTLWGGEFIRTRGITLAEIFYLLGVEPVRNSRGIVHDVRLIPSNELKRPRIDVVVQTSGQLRDVAASRIYLINRAVKLAAEADDGDKYTNYVKEGTVRAEDTMKEMGFSPLEARMFSAVRVFGGVNGNYGTGIMGLVESGDKWEEDKEISDRYLKNMGAMYTKDNWGEFRPGIFEAALQNTDTVVQPRSSNTWGPLSLDHIYEFMGGINATIRNVTGKDPDAYFNDLRNRSNPSVQGVKEAIWVETRTTLFNPKYIKALQEGGASSAEKFAETFRNTYGWNVMKPEVIDKELWEGLYDVYVRDKYGIELEKFFRDKNPYALQEMTAVMLETIRKEYWKADEDTVKTIAELHAKLVRDYKAGCSGFVCDNLKLREMIAGILDQELREDYKKEIMDARTGRVEGNKEGMKLEKEKITLEKVKEIIEENRTAVVFMFGITGLFAFAVIWGVVRQRT
ncbi:MAG: cobaltochelatase subunit CobN [Candidatus Omnitrophota bacterium]|nr:cobaltochelatase subunit CobN [Candidatus Omnitrophota bacterium]